MHFWEIVTLNTYAFLHVFFYSPGGALSGKYLDLDSVPMTARMRQYVGYQYR